MHLQACSKWITAATNMYIHVTGLCCLRLMAADGRRHHKDGTAGIAELMRTLLSRITSPA